MLNGGGVAQIIGTGGIGKSRLAAEAAFQHTSGTIWHRCSPTSQVADALVLIAQHLDIALTSKRAEIMAALTQRPALVVIDNAEDPRRAEYARLLAELAACHTPIILTSRTVWTEIKPRQDLIPTALDLPRRSSRAILRTPTGRRSPSPSRKRWRKRRVCTPA
jgi:hypothetical protein